MSYVIEEGIPLPAPTRSNGGPPRGPRNEVNRICLELKPGQSFLIDDYKQYMAARMFTWRSQTDMKFAFRKSRDGWRVWRTE